MPAELNYSQLNISLQLVQSPVPNYNILLFDYFTNLYNTGCRPMELFDNSLWTKQTASSYELTPLKHNNARNIADLQLTWYFRNALNEGYPLYSPLSYRRMRYHFQQFYVYSHPTVGGKDIELYLFRYRYIRALKLQGDSDALIIEKMGWTSASVLNGYLNNSIFVDG